MRLIDKDELDKLVGEPFEKFLSRLDLKCPETVEAIPIEWIKERMNKEEYRGFLVDHIEWHECLCWLIGKWRDENEQEQDS